MPEDFSGATLTLARTAAAKPVGAIVRVLDAHAVPAVYRLSAGTCTVGSAPPSNVVVADPTISRAHVELELTPAGVAVRDLGSHNGTFYLGQRVERIVLALGSRLSLGRATLAVDADVETLYRDPSFVGIDYAGIVGASPPMQRLFGLLQRLEASTVSVLIEGESGVGKELVARALHVRSALRGGPFVAVNCGALPRELVNSELFGHKKGAFTGALENRKGAFEAADGGTLFLDEIGELPLDVQPALLRAIESGEVQPVGSDAVRQVRVRFVAATNRALKAEVGRGRFREDLYYRLAVVRLHVPPLRERIDDIELLAHHFATDLGLEALEPELVEQLKGRAWPGNVRELRNAVQAYAALGELVEGAPLAPETIDHALATFVNVGRPYAEQKEALVERFARVYLAALMKHTDGNQTAAARLAGLNRGYLGQLLIKLGLSRSSDEGG
jgi:DNA-binding NtrC family response regulator